MTRNLRMTGIDTGAADGFRATFGENPEWQIWAPGRVNLIGDHTDYNLLPVLPMAIQRHVTVMGRSRPDDVINVVNHDAEFAPVTFRLLHDVQAGAAGSWENYVKAGPRALAQEHNASTGFDAFVSSDLPIAAGLSSSSALAVALGLATCQANSIVLPIPVMADLMARAERFVGTQGGGMDQAVCLGGEPDSAVRIDFAPLRLSPVRMPTQWRFVVAHSLIRAEKSASARDAYNERTEQCREGLARVIRALSPSPSGGETTFPDLIESYGVDAVLVTAARVLPGNVLMRFRHTVSEARRVNRAVVAMQSADVDGFGRLMIDSHRSLRDDYEVSTPELDELVTIMTGEGCAGARLTGAGFGGSVVGLTTVAAVDAVQKALVTRYYEPRMAHDVLDDALFVAAPSAGAKIVRL